MDLRRVGVYLELRLVEKCERVARIPAQLEVVPKRRYDYHSDLGRDKNWIGQRRVFIPWYSQDNCEIAESIKDNHGLLVCSRFVVRHRHRVTASTLRLEPRSLVTQTTRRALPVYILGPEWLAERKPPRRIQNPRVLSRSVATCASSRRVPS